MASPLWQRVRFGAYADDAPWPGVEPHLALERALGVRLPIMSWFLSMDSAWPAEQAAAAAASGHDLLICLEPQLSTGQAVPLASILSGAWDEHLDGLSEAASAYPGQVVIRFAHEPNLDRLPWSLDHPEPCVRDVQEWIATWRYVASRHPAANVRWMWCVDSGDSGAILAESYWPGADVVDLLGIDAYNGFGPWMPPAELIGPMYERVTALHPAAGLWLAETGCRPADPGEPHDKAAWFEDLLTSTQFPRLSTVSFFHADKEQDWRITDPAVRETLATYLASPAWRLER